MLRAHTTNSFFAIDSNKKELLQPLVIFNSIKEITFRDVLNLAHSSRALYNHVTDKNYWEVQCSIHFPDDYRKMVQAYEELFRVNPDSYEAKYFWFRKYGASYQRDYKHLTAGQREIITLIKAGNLALIKRKKLDIDTLLLRDAKGITFLAWASRTIKSNQEMLDYIYASIQIYVRDLYEKQGRNIPDKIDQIVFLRHFAIYCNQSYKTIAAQITAKNVNLKFRRHFFNPGQTAIIGNSALHDAAAVGNVPVVELILSFDPEVNSTNANAEKPLHLAAQFGHFKVVELLLKTNAEIEVENLEGETVLNVAARYGHKDILELLLSRVANPESALLSVLKTASRYGQVEILSMCFERKSFTMQELNSAFGTAIENEQLAAINAFINKFPNICKDYSTPDSFSVLMRAVKIGSLPVVKMLANNGATYTKDECTGETPLHLAANNIEVLHFLLEKYKTANLDEQIKERSHSPITYGDTALHFAVRHKNIDTVKALLAHGANPMITNEKGDLPLHIAGRLGCVEIFEVLSGKNEKMLDQPNNKNRQPLLSLHEVIKKNDIKLVVKVLKKNPAALLYVDGNGNSPVDLAKHISREGGKRGKQADEIIALLELIKYKYDRSGQIEYLHNFWGIKTFGIFGRRFNISKTEKLEMANALIELKFAQVELPKAEFNKKKIEFDTKYKYNGISNGELGNKYRKLSH